MGEGADLILGGQNRSLEKWLNLKSVRLTRKDRSVERSIINRINGVHTGPMANERAQGTKANGKKRGPVCFHNGV